MCSLVDIRIRTMTVEPAADNANELAGLYELFPVDEDGRCSGSSDLIELFTPPPGTHTCLENDAGWFCLACWTELDFWADVQMHVDDYDDEDDDGDEDLAPLGSWRLSFGWS